MTSFLIVAIIALIVAWAVSSNKLKSANKNLSVQLLILIGEKEKLAGQVAELEEKNKALSKYQNLVDTESKVKEMLFEAQIASDMLLAAAAELKGQARRELDQATISADNIKSEARADAKMLRQNATKQVENANEEAQLIIDRAEKAAKEIAGDAYYAMQNARELEKTAKAMRNIIEGYGDRYLIPTYSLIDDLAEEFGHTQAGEKLKMARERTRTMIKNGTSAKCDYVEANRSEKAINFILDAFNGKVDSILSKVKKDNYGTLEQKMKDAYQVVNNNGKAFRNAIITKEYLEARIDELKWATIALELKWDEQEEQRLIKEKIREEEKARRDFERAIKEAQKEEETLRRLIEKAEREVALASEEQKFKYEERLRELEGKLKNAEDKNQRAVSMAQQTKSGNVYIISNIGSFGENVYKIGMTRRLEPLDRIRELGDASVPFEFDVHALIFSENAPGLERELHKKFLRLQMNKVNPKKEFFKVGLTEIKNEIDGMNINARWTMTAAARSFRESLAIEEAISNDVLKQLEWEQHQLRVDPVTVEELEELEPELN